MKNKKGIYIIVGIVVFIILLTFIFIFSRIIKKDNFIVNNFEISLDNNVDKNEFTNLGPIKDEDSYSVTPYKFSIRNTDSQDSTYNLLIEDKIDNKNDLLSYYLKIQDEYGKLPKEVENLFEKKKLELLYNLHYIDSISNKNSIFEIVLTKEYSDNIDGIKLFEYCNNLSRDITINYKYGKLLLKVPSQKEAIDKILRLVDNLDKLEKDESR